MSAVSIRERFNAKYKGDVKDPVLDIILDTLDAYQKDVQEEHLLSVYSIWNNEFPDGLFEVFRRNLFGLMYPGPVFTIAQSSLRDVKTASPLLLEIFHHFSIQDSEGNKNIFAPIKPTWILPSFSNEVAVITDGTNLKLGFNIVSNNLKDVKNGFLSIYTGNLDILLMERLRCRIFNMFGFSSSKTEPKSIFKTVYPAVFNLLNDFFQTPYEQRFLLVPLEGFLAKSENIDNMLWLTIENFAQHASKLEKKLHINSFALWNMVEKEETIENYKSGFSYDLIGLALNGKETLISSVFDIGNDPATEYINSSVVMDPGYPYQFTASPDENNDMIKMVLNPPPVGDVRVHYHQYDLSDLCVNIPAGKPFSLYKGLDENLKSVQTLVPTGRNEVLNDKKRIWDYFRSMVSSRNRILSKTELKAAVRTYPPFGEHPDLISFEKITIEEKVGRVRGFLTPYSEIIVPVKTEELLTEPDKVYFERELGLYLKNKTVNGHFLRVKLLLDID